MKIPFAALPHAVVSRLNINIQRARVAGAYLQLDSGGAKYYGLSVTVVLLFIVSFVSILHADNWGEYSLLVLLGTLSAFLFAREIKVLWVRFRLGKKSIMFDEFYFFSIEGRAIRTIPLRDFRSSDITMFPGQGARLNFHFAGQNIMLKLGDEDEDALQSFQVALNAYTASSNQQLQAYPYGDLPSFSFLRIIWFQRTVLYIASFAALVLWFAIPRIIDSSQYQVAIQQNTASAFRHYLTESRNVFHREEAHRTIRGLYDTEISKYRELAKASRGAGSLVSVLEYLRDLDEYHVEMSFVSSSELTDLEDRGILRILPVTPSFTYEKNSARERQVIEVVTASMERVFPTDILSISSGSTSIVPRIRVYYTYRNNPESLYYPRTERNLPERARTYYYGIQIDWVLRIFLPNRPEPIYEFMIRSQPAEVFQSETLSTDVVYTSMAGSAFLDFQNEFRRQFLNW